MAQDFSLSVVVPLFNKADAIESTIRSVLAQSRLPDEVIVVDDGSTDGSASKAAAALALMPSRVGQRVISQPNSGVSAARNRGVEESTSNYVAFLDADDEWLPDCLAEFERLAQAFPAAAILSVRLAKRARNGTLVPEPSALAEGFFGIVPEPIHTYRKGYGILSSSSVAIRRDVWDGSGGFPTDARRGEDVHLWLRLLMSQEFAHSAQPLSIWRDEYSGAPARAGALPVHLTHFLATAEGRRHLSYPGLRGFLESNLLVQIVTVRLDGDEGVAKQLNALARSCSVATRLKCKAALIAPLWFLRAAASGWRKAIRTRRGRVPDPAAE